MTAQLVGPGGEVDVSDRVDRELGRVSLTAPVDLDAEGIATQDTLEQLRVLVELLLAGGLPAVLDSGALQVREQAPLAGFATEDTLVGLRDRTPVRQGTPWYDAGTEGGTFSVANGRRILGISAYANAADGSFTVGGGAAIMVRSGVGREWNPLGNLVGPLDIVFDASLDWIVEGIE